MLYMAVKGFIASRGKAEDRDWGRRSPVDWPVSAEALSRAGRILGKRSQQFARFQVCGQTEYHNVEFQRQAEILAGVVGSKLNQALPAIAVPAGPSGSELAGSSFPPQPPCTAVTPKEVLKVDGVLSSAQKCIIKAMWGLKCKLGAGNFQEVSDFLAKSWTSNPIGVKQLNGFLNNNFDGDPPSGNKERIQCFLDVFQQLG